MLFIYKERFITNTRGRDKPSRYAIKQKEYTMNISAEEAELQATTPEMTHDEIVKLAKSVLGTTTTLFGVIIWTMESPDTSLGEWLKEFTLGVTVDDVLDNVSLDDLKIAQANDNICYDLCQLSPQLSHCMSYIPEGDEPLLMVKIVDGAVLFRCNDIYLELDRYSRKRSEDRAYKQLNRPLMLKSIIETTTMAIATCFWQKDNPGLTLGQYISNSAFSLELGGAEVEAYLDKHYPGWEHNDNRCYLILGKLSQVTRERFMYDLATNTVAIVSLEGDLPVDKVQIAEEIINTTTDAIGVKFYQTDKPKCLMEHFLRDFDLQLSVTNVIKFLDEYYPGWETTCARCYYDLGNISPATSTRFIYNRETRASVIVPIQMVYDPKRGNVDSAWLSVNMMPKPAQEVTLQYTAPEGMENTPYFMRPTVTQGANDLNKQLDEKEETLTKILRAMATLFWVAELPNVSLEQYISTFDWPKEKVKLKICKDYLSYADTVAVYAIMDDVEVLSAIPEVGDLLARIEQVRYNPYLKGKFIYHPSTDTGKVISKVLKMSL